MNSEPSVDLIKRGCSQNDEVILDTLQLLFKDGEPAFRWAVSWRGGVSHADGAGGYEIVPPDMRSHLVPISLMKRISSFLKEPDVMAFATDKRVVAWCETVRKLYPSKASDLSSTVSDSSSTASDPSLIVRYAKAFAGLLKRYFGKRHFDQ